MCFVLFLSCLLPAYWEFLHFALCQEILKLLLIHTGVQVVMMQFWFPFSSSFFWLVQAQACSVLECCPAAVYVLDNTFVLNSQHS